MHSFMLSQSFFLDSAEKVKNVPRYSVTVVDHHQDEHLQKKTLGVFVMPQGTERHLDFNNQIKRGEIVEQASFSRLIIVKLG